MTALLTQRQVTLQPHLPQDLEASVLQSCDSNWDNLVALSALSQKEQTMLLLSAAPGLMLAPLLELAVLSRLRLMNRFQPPRPPRHQVRLVE